MGIPIDATDITKIQGYDTQYHTDELENLGEKADITKIIRGHGKW